ncbi:unnamed protein product [Leptidea sinapis]|uniref:Uncharacterized protein n=1 Tax=Leptidea sinapis TaxID=189913 RepID=A0A5E4QJ31_9NEOP|nr:unnamed protein product [Leptidea sinapis]
MALCYQKHPFEIETEDRLTTINTKIFEIKKKIQLSENEAEKKQNNDLIDTLKKEIKLRLHELNLAKEVLSNEEAEVKKYLNDKGSKKKRLKELEKEYEKLLIESTKSDLVKSKITTRAKKHISHLENEIHTVLIQWTEAELVKKKYSSIRQALREDSVKFESSLANMRARATAATAAEAARAHDAEHARAAERAYFAQRFDERRRELEKLEKRIFPPPLRAVRQESVGSTEGVTEAEEVFDRFRAQRETSVRLNYLQQTTEEEKLQLEQAQTSLIAELEGYKFASVKEKDEGQEEITNLKGMIEEEGELYRKLEKEVEELDTFLLEIKRLLYELCKMLDVIPDPPTPEWTAEARDIQEIIQVLSIRYEKARIRTEAILEKQKDTAVIMHPEGIRQATTDLQGAGAPGATSDEEEDIPSRCYLKRQAQLIVDTKCRRKGFRPPYPRK